MPGDHSRQGNGALPRGNSILAGGDSSRGDSRSLAITHRHAFLRVRVAPQGTKLAVWLDAHGFALPESQGPWRGQNGRLLGQSAANGEHLLGLELDLVANWRPSPAISVQGGYSVFVPGPAAENLGHDELSQFFYLMLDLRLP